MKRNHQHSERAALDSGPADARPSFPRRSGINRRSFLKRGGVAAAAAGFIAIPGGTAILGAFESEAPALDSEASAATETEVASMPDAVVAHVKDLSSGDISIYSGTNEVVLRNPALAAQIFRASR
jgi:hypothetical protein